MVRYARSQKWVNKWLFTRKTNIQNRRHEDNTTIFCQPNNLIILLLLTFCTLFISQIT